ncbi:hypothetical protein GLW08_10550 [Pontibacillus yanchengensis]|uniref:Uncharacterized protein n=2 Tax=Pontibacillus yanchengensis TaxID=462910 RepID=A0ACC7VHX7_9BACI|nr:PD-(D/E)XK nuclease family protein [Pontibacillus yanchengensis]MYL34308.1 hypothetical protein [Pontibacillus yanchengensis]MYL53776.1 hypothetical protein [Pontibacillus yanchengensis]
MKQDSNQELYLKISRFLSNNELLFELNSSLREFNPFKVLKVDQYEIRHSNMLAWLLDPKENHDIGDLFLKKFPLNCYVIPQLYL